MLIPVPVVMVNILLFSCPVMAFPIPEVLVEVIRFGVHCKAVSLITED